MAGFTLGYATAVRIDLTHAHRRTRLVGVVIYHMTVLSWHTLIFLAKCGWLNYPLSPKRRDLKLRNFLYALW